MFDEESYYSFKIFELLLAESDLRDWIKYNPQLSTSDFLTCFLIYLGPFLENNYLSPTMKNNALNYLNLVRFSEYNNNKEKIELVNAIIRLINSQDSSKYLNFYRQEMYKRTMDKQCLTKYNDSIIINNEQNLLESIKYDQFVLISHSNQINDEIFNEEFLPALLSELHYFKTINCILEEYPQQFKNPVFLMRYNIVINNFLQIQESISSYKTLTTYNNRVINKVKKI